MTPVGSELRAAEGSSGPAAPPWPHQPTVEWQICGSCNYHCEYCIQSPVRRKGEPSDSLVARMLAFLSTLTGQWEIKMTGGEPFSTRLLLDRIVPGLVEQTGHRISLLTNLSSPPSILRRFATQTAGRLAVVSASLHLDFTAVEPFLERLMALREAAGVGPRFVVNAVLVPRLFDQLARARGAIEAAGFRFFPQLMKVKNGVFPYSLAERERIDVLLGGWAKAEAQRSANLAPAYEGRRCWAGARYLVLTQTGEAWACRTARRHQDGFLGRVCEIVELRSSPLVCPYALCPCAVPANRGMIEGVAARLSAEDDES
jgi:MoaA/NifB/PqqE/SkfB family radical SAM enzyme